MTTKQKCEKLAKVLENLAKELRDPLTGSDVWNTNSVSIQAITAHSHLILKQLNPKKSTTQKTLSKTKKPTKNRQTEDPFLDDWPDTLS